VLRLFDLRRGEGRLAAPAMALALLVFTAQVLAMLVSDAVSVTTFDLGVLSGYVVVASIVRVALTFGYTAVARGGGARRGAVLLAGAAAVTTALGAALDVGSVSAVYASCLALLIVPVAAGDAASAAMEAFPARQGKRLLPLIGAASSLGGLLAGIFARGLTPRIGTPHLLWIVGACLLGAAAVTPWVERARSERAVRPMEVPTHAVHDLRTIPVVRTAFGLAVLVAATTAISDYLFKATLKASFARDAMTEYTGVLEAVLSVGAAAAQLFLTARVAGRLGVRSSLLLYPAAIAATAPAFALAPRVATATATKLSETFLRFSVMSPLRALLISPLQTGERARASALLRGAAIPLGGVVAGTALRAFGPHGPPTTVMAGMLVVTCGALFVVVARSRRAYTAALASALGEGRLTLDVPPTQAAALRAGLEEALRQATSNGDERQAAKLRALLASRDAADEEAAPASVADPDPELEIEGLQARGERGLFRRDALRAVRRLVRRGPDACEHLLAKWAGLARGAREAAARLLSAAPDAVRRGIGRAAIERAIGLTLDEGEGFARALVTHAGAGVLLQRELGLRVTTSAVCAVDLAAIHGDRARIAKARAALSRTARSRADALELLENVLPRAFAGRTLALLELDPSTAPPPLGPGGILDPWLETCRLHGAGELSSATVRALLDRVVVLGESSLFDGMTSEELYPIAEIAEVVELGAGEAAVRQGDPGDAVFVVESGTLEVRQDARKLKEVGRGSVFGEMSLLDGSPRSASVLAVTKARVLRIPRPEFDALLDEYPEIARGVIRTLLAHLRS
jgi:hypothetical protein